jgi:CheY-like chemotaxis protein
MRSGPIVLVEDDEDDQFLVKRMLQELGVSNPVRLFTNGRQVLDYLMTTSEQPFIIMCDVNMPIMSGLELRQYIDADVILRDKAIPFIFLTTDASWHLIKAAYRATIQGFFKKATSYEAAKEQLQWIIGYWQHCLHPHNID